MRSELADHLEKKVLQLLAANPSLRTREVAALVNRSTKTIERIVKKNKQLIAETDELLELQTNLKILQTSEDVALNYVDLATNDKNGAARLAAQMRIDDLLGIVTEKERLRAKSHEQVQPGPLFIFPPGTAIDVTVNQTIQRAADSASAKQDQQVIDVESESDSH